MRRTLAPGFPLDLGLTLAPVRRGGVDPTMRLGEHEVWRASRTPDGPATVHIRVDGDRLEAHAWGPGTDRALGAVASLAGMDDDPGPFRPEHPVLRRLHRQLRGLRLPRTGALVEALVPSILEQKVTGIEAWRSYAALVRAWGEPAPGPAGLYLPPAPERLAGTPYHSFHRFGIERRRATTVIRACAQQRRIEVAEARGPDPARAALLAIPGIGRWTVAEATRLAFGDPDEVSVGDYNLPHLVSWALGGEPRGDDARMLELLEPYRGQRARAVRLLEVSGIRAPRHGPRARLRSIARI